MIGSRLINTLAFRPVDEDITIVPSEAGNGCLLLAAVCHAGHSSNCKHSCFDCISELECGLAQCASAITLGGENASAGHLSVSVKNLYGVVNGWMDGQVPEMTIVNYRLILHSISLPCNLILFHAI